MALFAIILYSCAGESSETVTNDSIATPASVASDEEEDAAAKEAAAKQLEEEELRLAEEARKKAEQDSIEEAEQLAELEAKAEAEKKEKEAVEAKKRAEAKRKEEARRRAEEEKRKAEAAAATIKVEDLPISQPVIKPNKPEKPKGAKIEFVTKTYNFGTIKEGEVVKYEFEYTNVGNSELVIKDAKASCGCTAPGFSFFPLEPGLSSAISVSFNSANKVGAQRPEITIYTNGYPSKHVLTLEGNVVK